MPGAAGIRIRGCWTGRPDRRTRRAGGSDVTSPDAEGSGETAQRFAAMLRRLRLRTGRGWEGEGRLTRRPRSHAVRTVSVAAVLACLVPLACSTPGIADRAPG